MNVLIIGGTRFVGRALVQQLLKGGHRVTLFNRGQSNSKVFRDNGNVSFLQGDRNLEQDLRQLRNCSFDAVIDTCAYLPAQVGAMAGALKGSVSRYVLISTISVFADSPEPGLHEDSDKIILPQSRQEIDRLTIRDIDGSNYGGLKYLCEQELDKHWPHESIIIRPGMIIGPWDDTERFNRWVKAFMGNGPVIAPAPADLPIQFIDVIDLADFIISLLERGVGGDFNVVGPEEQTSFGQIFDVIREVTGSSSQLCWADDKYLTDHGLLENFHGNFPFFVRPSEASQYLFSNARARKAGLKFSPHTKIIANIVKFIQEFNASLA